MFISFCICFGCRSEGTIFSTAASNHMVVNDTALHNITEVSDKVVEVADGSVIAVKSSGDVYLKGGVCLQGALLVPDLTDNLISLGRLDSDGMKIVIEKGVMTVWKDEKVIAKAKNRQNLYYLEEKNEVIERALAVSEVTVEKASAAMTKKQWHSRLGHLNVSFVIP